MTLDDWLDRYRNMVKELAAHQKVAVLNDCIRPGIPDADLADVERRLGTPLPEGVRTLYRQADGLSLRWISRKDPRAEELDLALTTDYLDFDAVIGHDGVASGCICLLPLRQALVEADWKDMIAFEDIQVDDLPENFTQGAQ